MEGELKKLVQSLMKEEDSINWGWGCQAIELISKKVDEAKKEFPFLEKNILLHGDSFKIEDTLEETVKAQERWFKRWFGEAGEP